MDMPSIAMPFGCGSTTVRTRCFPRTYYYTHNRARAVYRITQNPKTFPWGLLFHVKGPTRGCYTVITSTVVRRLLYTARKRMLKFLYIYGGGGHGPPLPPDLVLWMSQSVPPSVMSFMLLLFTEEMMLPAVCWCSCSLCWVDC